MNNLLLWILSLGHMVVDLNQGALPIFLPYLEESFNLSYFQIGLVTLFFTFSSAIIQPLFGVASDKFSMPWLMPLGLFLAGIGMAFVGWVDSFALLLAAVLISGLGVAAYHPEGSKVTHFASIGRLEGTSMAVFAVGGNVGIGLGPILAAFLIGGGTLKGSWGMLIPGALVGLLFLFLLPKINQVLDSGKLVQQQTLASTSEIKGSNRGPLAILIAFVIFRSWIHASLLNFIPFYFPRFRGTTDEYAAFLLTAFLIAGAVGTILGGPIADKLGLKTSLIGSMVLTGLTTFPFLHLSGFWAAILAVINGAALISTFSITVVFGQKLMPNNVGVASGLMLGFAIGTGSVGVVVLGAVADQFGLPFTLNMVSLFPIAAVILASLLPEPGSKKEAPSTEPQPMEK